MDSDEPTSKPDIEGEPSKAPSAEGKGGEKTTNDENGHIADQSQGGGSENGESGALKEGASAKAEASTHEDFLNEEKERIVSNGAHGEGEDKGAFGKELDGVEIDMEDDKANLGNSNTVGRRGDPRMNRAVKARLENPNLSLLEALILGGFQFPDGTDADGKSDRNICDADNVLLCQRKNQLSRRLRLAKKRTNSDPGDISAVDVQEQGKEIPDSPTESTPSSGNQQSSKRPHDGSGEQQPSLDSRVNGANIPNGTAMQHPNLAAALLQQHTAGLGQHAGYFGGNQFLNMQQQGFGSPFLGQFPLNYALGMKGNLGQSGQTPLDHYLQMAAASMGANPQSMLFPQNNFATNIGNQQQARHPSNTPASANSSSLQKDENEIPVHSDNIDAAKKDGEGEKVLKLDDGQELKRSKKLDQAVKTFNTENPPLIKRCLILAGFTEEELQNRPGILTDFEEQIKNNNS